jgi:hypothetical protein
MAIFVSIRAVIMTARDWSAQAGHPEHNGSPRHPFAPNLVKAAVEGRLPRGMGVERLRDPPTEWSRQFEALGLNPE